MGYELLLSASTILTSAQLASPAGKLSPERSVFEYIYKYADSIAVGITTEEEMEKTYSVALASG
jgi:hypothetical protein